MLTHDPRWSLPHGNTPVPSRWQATDSEECSIKHMTGTLTALEAAILIWEVRFRPAGIDSR
jgi:hypothetical protein